MSCVSIASAAAQDTPATATLIEFQTPKLQAARTDWQAAFTQMHAELGDSFEGRSFAQQQGRRAADVRTMVPHALLHLNDLSSNLFPTISRSPVPVLLPLATTTLVRADIDSAETVPADVLAGFTPLMFESGLSGYSAGFALPPDVIEGTRRRVYSKPVEIQITGSRLLYDIRDPLSGKGLPVTTLATDYPDLRRVIREGYVRYHFTRFGTAYVVSIHCIDTPPRNKRLACREAFPVAERFIKALRVSGGRQAIGLRVSEPEAVIRPARFDAAFSYHRAGEILEGTGYRGQPGHADQTVYAQIRFPLAAAPAYANSQSFLNWGDCFQRGRIPRPRKKDAIYHCKGSDKPLRFNEADPENYSYPWRDNFCEARSFGVGQCATGHGHQGQDIRPASCSLRNDGADRCTPSGHAVIAARDGVIVRSAGQQGAYLLVNTARDHFRLRYMHMDPRQLDRDGVLNGRVVTEGEVIGSVSNYQDHPGGTTNHLHLDLQVFTREGWLWVNPYTTLIASYERMIGGRGHEIPPAPQGVTPPVPADDKEPGADAERADAAPGDSLIASSPQPSH